MRTPFPRLAAILAAVSLLTPTALGFSSTSVPPSEATMVVTEEASHPARDPDSMRTQVTARLLALGDEPDAARVATARLTEVDLAVLTAHPDMLQRGGSGRDAIGERLVAVGHTTTEATLLSSRLTRDDILVLLRHPEMLQRAGDMSQTTQAYIIIALIVGGIIALAASSNGSGVVMVN